MLNELKKLKDQAIKEIQKSKALDQLRGLEVKYLGRKGELTKLLRRVKDLTIEEKPKFGQLANEVKQELSRLFLDFKDRLEPSTPGSSGAGEYLDLTLPGRRYLQGHLHPHTLIQYQLEEIFSNMGFLVLEGPELESEYYNFESLNVPPAHPARDIQDTFFIKDKANQVLRTQTSNQQVRVMEKYGAPLRAVFPGRVFRNEATDSSHETTFYQWEGLMIDKDISIAHLISTMKTMLKGIFKQEVAVRLRPGYFPFVEPGFEVDVSCVICQGKGCTVCKKSGWVEMIGSGLVHPNVLRAGGLNPEKYSGFAFGMGLTRLAMMKYGIDDIRLFLSGDLRFLNQF